MDKNTASKALAKLAQIQAALKLQLSEEPPAPAPDETGITLTGKDGSIYKTETEPAEGVEIMVVTADGESVAPDGDVELEDGRIITIKDGKIEAVKPSPMGPDPNMPVAQQMKAIMAGLDPTGDSKDPVTTMLRALMEATFGWEIRNQEQQTTRDAAIQAYKTQMSSQEGEINKLKKEINDLKNMRKQENEQIIGAFDAALEAIDAVAKAPLGGEDKKPVFPKTSSGGGPLGRKAEQA